MKSLWVFLVLTASQWLVMCLVVNAQNDTERIKRDADDMNKMMFGSFNTKVESKCAEKCFSPELTTSN